MRNKVEAVKSYLSRQFTGRYIEHHADTDSDAQCFKVHLEEGTLLLKITDEVLRDQSASQVKALLADTAVVAELWRQKGTARGLLLSSGGLSHFARG